MTGANPVPYGAGMDVGTRIMRAASIARLDGDAVVCRTASAQSWIWLVEGDREWLEIAAREDPDSVDTFGELSRYTAVLAGVSNAPSGALGVLVGYVVRGRRGVSGNLRLFRRVTDIDEDWMAGALRAARQQIEALR